MCSLKVRRVCWDLHIPHRTPSCDSGRIRWSSALRGTPPAPLTQSSESVVGKRQRVCPSFAFRFPSQPSLILSLQHLGWCLEERKNAGERLFCGCYYPFFKKSQRNSPHPLKAFTCSHLHIGRNDRARETSDLPSLTRARPGLRSNGKRTASSVVVEPIIRGSAVGRACWASCKGRISSYQNFRKDRREREGGRARQGGEKGTLFYFIFVEENGKKPRAVL